MVQRLNTVHIRFTYIAHNVHAQSLGSLKAVLPLALEATILVQRKHSIQEHMWTVLLRQQSTVRSQWQVDKIGDNLDQS